MAISTGTLGGARGGISVKLNGIDRVVAYMQKLHPNAEKLMRKEIARAGINIQREASIRCPVDTGRLRSSIHPVFSTDGLSAEIGAGAMRYGSKDIAGTNVEYAAFVEFGTRRMRAHPFLFPAFEVEWRRLVDAITKILTRFASSGGRA